MKREELVLVKEILNVIASLADIITLVNKLNLLFKEL